LVGGNGNPGGSRNKLTVLTGLVHPEIYHLRTFNVPERDEQLLFVSVIDFSYKHGTSF
jgi:hypothetical protein